MSYERILEQLPMQDLYAIEWMKIPREYVMQRNPK